MEEKLRQTIIDNYNTILINMENNKISSAELGFVKDECTPAIFAILIHCIENVDIFNTTQLNNISHFINKLTYA